MIIKFRAKLQIFTEEDLETSQTYDLGTMINKEIVWGWRDIAFLSSEIYRIEAFSKTKTRLIMMEEGETYLVDEPFDKVFDKWTAALDEYSEDDQLFTEKKSTLKDEENENNLNG